MNVTPLVDTLIRSLGKGSSRRNVLRALPAAVLLVAVGRLSEGTDAARHHKHHKHHKNNKPHRRKKQKSDMPVVQIPEETPPAPPPSSPQTTADALCAPAGSPAGFTGSRRFAQSFVALRSGALTSASVSMSSNAEGTDFELEIRNVDTSGTPTNVLASTSITDVPKTAFNEPPRSITGTFVSPANVVAGQRYALTVTVAPQQGFTIRVEQGDPCANSKLFVDSFADGKFQPQNGVDLIFSTFVTG
jgi:hypothetical protein